MGNYVAKSFLKQLPMRSDFTNKVLICGYTFKENCADIRNTKVRDIANYLVKNKIMVSIYDPWLTKKNIQELKNFDVLEEFPNSLFNGIIIAVAHKKFKEIGLEKIKSLTVPNSPIYDVKSLFLSSEEDGITYL